MSFSVYHTVDNGNLTFFVLKYENKSGSAPVEKMYCAGHETFTKNALLKQDGAIEAA